MATESCPTPIQALTRVSCEAMDANWRAANQVSAGQIYLSDNPLLKRPLELSDVKRMLLGAGARPRGRTSSLCT